jgi:hypothetical protein
MQKVTRHTYHLLRHTIIRRMSVQISDRINNLLLEDLDQCDADMDRFLKLLAKAKANMCWHKHSTFKDHLFDVWRILYIWKQPTPVCRLGMFHSSYSNSYVNLAIFNPNTERQVVRDTIGQEAEELVHLFCIIPRQELIFEKLFPFVQQKDFSNVDQIVPKEGITLKHIRTGENILVSRYHVCTFIVTTIADFVDQLFGWQDDMFDPMAYQGAPMKGNDHKCLWPGDGRPGIYLSFLSKLGQLVHVLKDDRIIIPPVFDNLTKIIDEQDEKRARDLYWDVITMKNRKEYSQEAETSLKECCRLNPFIGEPHAVLAQIYLQDARYEEAEKEASEAIRIMCEWGTAYDKRITWQGWLAWARVLHQNAVDRTWPNTALGMINLGLVK